MLQFGIYRNSGQRFLFKNGSKENLEQIIFALAKETVHPTARQSSIQSSEDLKVLAQEKFLSGNFIFYFMSIVEPQKQYFHQTIIRRVANFCDRWSGFYERNMGLM